MVEMFIVEISGVERCVVKKSGVEKLLLALELKCPGLKLGVEKSGVVMSFNHTACCWPTRTTELLAQNSYFRNSGEWVPNPLFYAPLFPLDIFKG